ncbi:MAG: 50S ribosomal protein L4 [Candidatus Woesearchaeota archaeon]
MDLTIRSPTNAEEGKKRLPAQFSEPVRPDLIKRAVEAIWSHERQPYSSDPYAGKKASAKLSRRRREYRGGYGHGISRVPRKILSRNGTQMYWVAANAPGTVKGRRAHPPVASKNWVQKINNKERKKAIRSALAATVDKKFVLEHHHVLPKEYPFIISNSFEALTKTSEVKKALNSLGLQQELERSSRKKIRAGKGKTRGRKYRSATGPLIVVGTKDCNLLKAAANLAGIDVAEVSRLNASLLAPGAVPGRLTLYTANAIDKIAKEKLFV